MTPMTTGHSPRAEANRRHILDVALTELLRDPDASMDQIARAAGVVRRTVYGHFPSREALIGTLVDGAVEAVAAAHAAGREGAEDLAQAVAGSVLAVWEVADRYRILVALAQRSVTVQGIRERLAPCARPVPSCSGAAWTRGSSSHRCPRPRWRTSTSR